MTTHVRPLDRESFAAAWGLVGRKVSKRAKLDEKVVGHVQASKPPTIDQPVRNEVYRPERWPR